MLSGIKLIKNSASDKWIESGNVSKKLIALLISREDMIDFDSSNNVVAEGISGSH